MQRGKFCSARSGGDALKQTDCGRTPLQYRDEKACKLNWNAGNEGVKVDRHGAGQTDWIDKIASCPVYYPTEEEFVDPLQYIQKIAREASEYGICKIVSPVVASVPAGVVLTKEQTNFKFTTRVQPMRLSNWDKDDKTTFPMSGRLYTLTEYEKAANKAFARKFSTAAALPTKFVEAEFWKELVSGKTQTVEYASDVEGSAFSGSCTDPLGQSRWNLKGLSRLADSTLRLLEIVIPGVTEPMLYIGMLFSMFAWHIEDHYLYSINYHHFGAPKTWYGVPGKSAPDFEQIVEKYVYETEMLKDSGKGSQYDLLLGKTTMFAPKLLSEHGVPVYRAVQNPGEFVVTFPRAYHAGFSHGFNCGEAVNFAMADWFPFGASACSRYEYLNRIPLLPHEELLCKEAVMISQLGSYPPDSRTFRQLAHVKIAFVSLMRSQLQAYEHLKKRGAKSATSSTMNVLCGLCKHPCYIAYTECKCYPEPTCLKHERVVSACTCGIARSLVVRDDLTTLQEVALAYESENDILSEVLKGPSIYDSLLDGAGSGVGEEEFLLTRASSSGREAMNGSNEVSLSGEKGHNLLESVSGKTSHNLLEGNSVLYAKDQIGITTLDSKQDQEDDSSDSEAFRVKRRRLLPSRSKRFQVDEQVLSPKKLLANGMVVGAGIDKKLQGNSEVTAKERRLEPLIKKHPLLVQDVIKELGIKGSVGEVIGRWQHDAKRQGITIKTKQVSLADRLVEAISLKSCMSLKQILSEGQTRRLEMLMRQIQQPLVLTINSSCSIQGNNEPTAAVFPVQKKVLSAGKKDAPKSVDRTISDNRKVLQQAISEIDTVDSSTGLLKEVTALDRKHCSLPSTGNIYKNGILGRRKRRTDNALFPEGSSSNAEFQCRKQIQKVSRLKVKGPTPPVRSCDILPKEAGQVEGGSSEMQTLKRGNRSVQHYVGVNDDKQLLGVVAKNERGEIAERKLIKEHRTERTEAMLGSESSKILIVHLNRKVNQQEGSVTSSSADDNKNKPDEKRERKSGSVLQEADKRDPREAVSVSTVGGGSLEHQTVDLLGSSSAISSWHAPMEPFSNSPEAFNSPKESDLQLGSVLDEGDVREEFRGSRNHVDLQHAEDCLSQGFEHNSDKFSSKTVARKSSARESKRAAGEIKTPVVDGKERCLVNHMLCAVSEDTNRQSGGGAKEQLDSGICSVRCNRKDHNPLPSTENARASRSQHAQEYHQQVKDVFSRRFCPEKNQSRAEYCAVSGSRGHSPPGEIHSRGERLKDEVGNDEDAGVGQNSGWRVSGHAQRSSSLPRSPVVSDKLRATANDSLRCGLLSKTASKKNPSCTSKSSLHGHHDSRTDNGRTLKNYRSCQGQEAMQQQLCRPHRFRDGDIKYEGELHSDDTSPKGQFSRLEGAVADKQGGSCRDEAGDDWDFSSVQNCLEHSCPRPGRTA